MLNKENLRFEILTIVSVIAHTCITRCAGGGPAPWKLTFDFLTYLESGVRVTSDVGYLCANFSLPRPLCSRLRPDVRDRQTSDAHHRLMPRYGGHNKQTKLPVRCVGKMKMSIAE